MYPARRFRVCLVTILVALACSEESTTSVPFVDAEAHTDLALTFPRLTTETLVQGESVEITAPPGPAGSFSDGGPTVPDDAVAQIFGASTNVGFQANYAFANGRQSYNGNKGRVETTAIVTYGGTQIGTQSAFREEYVPFLLDFGQIKEIVAEAYVFIDQECGLKVDGNSRHFSGWQWFLGGPAPNWGPASESTQAFPPKSQAACAEEVPSPETGSTGGDEAGGAEGFDPVTCWYWVTYDPYTGEIYDAEFLFCDGASEGG